MLKSISLSWTPKPLLTMTSPCRLRAERERTLIDALVLPPPPQISKAPCLLLSCAPFKALWSRRRSSTQYGLIFRKECNPPSFLPSQPSAIYLSISRPFSLSLSFCDDDSCFWSSRFLSSKIFAAAVGFFASFAAAEAASVGN